MKKMEQSETKKFEDLTAQELKALAYDCLATIELNQNNLRAINARLAELNKKIDA